MKKAFKNNARGFPYVIESITKTSKKAVSKVARKHYSFKQPKGARNEKRILFQSRPEEEAKPGSFASCSPNHVGETKR